MFEDSPGIYTAKVADFGFSTHFHDKQDLIKMPKSEPWSAPEHHDRYFYPQDAKVMDVYSFSMLCLWLLFGIEISKTTPYPSEAAKEAGMFSFDPQHWSQKRDLLLCWKRDWLLKWAIQLAIGDGHFAAEIRDRVTRFFQSSLGFNPQTRTTDWCLLLSFLDPTR
jgi:serine/threonine protein kinase